MKQLAGLLQKASHKKHTKFLVHDRTLMCPNTQFGGALLAKLNTPAPTAVFRSWATRSQFDTLAKGAELVFDGVDVFVRSKDGANITLPRVAEDDDAKHWVINFDNGFEEVGAFTLHDDALKRRMLTYLAAAQTGDSRYIYAGVNVNLSTPARPKFEVTDGRFAIVADAEFAQVVTTPVPEGIVRDNPVIPANALAAFLKLRNVPIRVSWNATYFRIMCEVDGWHVTYEDRLLEGKFPDISRIISEPSHSFPIGDFIQSIVDTPFVRNAPSHLLYFSAQPAGPEPRIELKQLDDDGNMLILKEYGGAFSELRVTVTGGVNHTYLTAALRALGADPTMGFKLNTTKNSAGNEVFTDTFISNPVILQSSDCTALVMPIRI